MGGGFKTVESLKPTAVLIQSTNDAKCPTGKLFSKQGSLLGQVVGYQQYRNALKAVGDEVLSTISEVKNIGQLFDFKQQKLDLISVGNKFKDQIVQTATGFWQQQVGEIDNINNIFKGFGFKLENSIVCPALEQAEKVQEESSKVTKTNDRANFKTLIDPTNPGRLETVGSVQATTQTTTSSGMS